MVFSTVICIQEIFLLFRPILGKQLLGIGLIRLRHHGLVTRRARESLVRIFVALHQEDFETLCFEGYGLGQTIHRYRPRELSARFARSYRTRSRVASGKVNVGRMLLEATAIAARHKIRVPRDWMIVFKAIYTLEGTCRKLNPNFNAIPLLESFVTPILQRNFPGQIFPEN